MMIQILEMCRIHYDRDESIKKNIFILRKLNDIRGFREDARAIRELHYLHPIGRNRVDNSMIN